MVLAGGQKTFYRLGVTVSPVLSCFQAQPLLDARRRGESQSSSSLDLGLSPQMAALTSEGVTFASGAMLSWPELQQIATEENVCFQIVSGLLEPIRHYSEETERTYQLMPTLSSPALLISGFVMHRVKGVSPHEGAWRMVDALGKVRGRVLDTATGLGYAAIEAARRGSAVLTIERDAGAQHIARSSPWSRGLFERAKVTQMMGDSSALIQSLPSASFAALIHDPPAMSLAGELYSEAFYTEAYRVLKPSGRMFHYVGDPNSASGGRTTHGVQRRLRAAGFTRVIPQPEAFGLLACK